MHSHLSQQTAKFMFFIVVVSVSAAAALAFGYSFQRTPSKTGTVWDQFVDQFVESYFSIRPDAAINAGRHEFDGKLRDFTMAGLTKEADYLRAQRERAKRLPASELTAAENLDRDNLMSFIDRQLFWLEDARWPQKSPDFYAGSLDPNVYVARDYAPLRERLRAYINYAKAIPGAAEQIQKNLKAPLARPYINIGKVRFGGLASFYEKEVPKIFASVADANLQAEFRLANRAAADSMKRLAAWLGDQLGAATNDFALGNSLFREMLRTQEQLDISIDELQTIGQKDLDRNTAFLRQTCAMYAPGAPIEECVARVEKTKPAGGFVEGARRQLKELKAFVSEKRIVSIPGTEEANVAEAPEYQRANGAYISIPGPFEKGDVKATYYIAPPDLSWSEAERQAYLPSSARLVFTSAHEVWPGHFLERLHTKRSTLKFSRVFGGSAAFSEGWAHYTEEMIREMGFGSGQPELQIAQTVEALTRDVRFLSAIGLHTKGMSLETSERMFRELAYRDIGTARQQAARGTYDPGYLSYTLGKLMIRKLRDDWTASRGGRAAWHDFHDQFLSYGRMPVPLVRKVMLGATAGSPL